MGEKVFVSHTTDMASFPSPRSFVDAALDSVIRLGLAPVEMRFFGSSNESPAVYCRNQVRECSIYLAIIGFRYGSLVPDTEMSYTELEFLEASDRALPRYVFLLDADAPVPASLIDTDRTPAERFRERLRGSGLLVHTFGSVEQLEMLVFQALGRANTDRLASTTANEFDRDAYLHQLVERYWTIDLDILTPLDQDGQVPMQLRSVFEPQNVRADLPPMELSADLRRKLIEDGEISPSDLPESVDGQRLLMAWAGYRRRPARQILEVVTSESQRLLVILGDPGSGKSTLLRYLTLSLAVGDNHEPKLADRLPVLVELRRYIEPSWRTKTLVEYIDFLNAAEGVGVPGAFLERALSERKVILCLDGLDELFDPAVRESVMRQIAYLARRYPRVRMIVTSRVIGYRSSILGPAGFQHYTIQELTDAQIRSFISRWYRLACAGDVHEANRRSERLLSAVRQSASVRDLAGNPLLLSILAIIGGRQELPRDRRAVYAHAVSVLIEHWDVNRHLADARIDMAYLDQNDKFEMLRRVARQMQTARQSRSGNYIAGSELLRIFESYLQEDYSVPRERAKPVANSILAQLRERNFILGRMGAEVYGFVHRAFLEYLCASDIVHRFQEKREFTPESLSEVFFGRHYADPAWQEVLRLVVGMVDESFAAQIISRLLAADPSWSPDSDRVPQHIVLAVRCVGEVRKIGRISETATSVLDAIIGLLDESLSRQPDLLLERVLDTTQEALDQILPTLYNVGAAWPGRDRLLDWFQTVTFDSASLAYPRAMSAAAHALAFLMPDRPDVRSRLCTLAVDSQSWSARAAALQACAVTWRDGEEIRSLVVERATNDPHRFVRASAVEAVAAQWPDDPQSVDVVRDRATHDPDAFVRSAAIEALGAWWPNEPAARSAIHLAAGSDRDGSVRRSATRLADEMAVAQKDSEGTSP